MPVEKRGCGVGLALPERLDVEMCRRERTVAERGPRCNLERVEVVGACPRRDLGERALRHACSEESELHVATSIHESVAAERSTASVSTAARNPSAKVGSPSTVSPRTVAYTSPTNALKLS